LTFSNEVAALVAALFAIEALYCVRISVTRTSVGCVLSSSTSLAASACLLIYIACTSALVDNVIAIFTIFAIFTFSKLGVFPGGATALIGNVLSRGTGSAIRAGDSVRGAYA
jgi:uncharacterized membrane protein YGL010W